MTAVEGIHEGLAEKGLLPEEHLAGGAYLSLSVLVKSQGGYEVDMVGPMRMDKSWQVRDPEAFELAQFTVDWDAQQATCPQVKQSYKWSPG